MKRFLLGAPAVGRPPKALAEDPPPAPAHASVVTLLGLTLLRFGRNQIPLVSAGVTFYLLLALFPAVNAVLSIYSLFVTGQAQPQLGPLEFILPSGGVEVINEAVERLSSSGAPVRHIALVISVLLWVWSANAGVKAFFTGLNITYGASETRSFAVLNLTSLAFTAGGTLAVVLAMVFVATAPAALAGHHLAVASWVTDLRWPLLLAATAPVLWLFYRFGAAPGGDRPRGPMAAGVALSAFTWIGGSAAFAWYVSAFGQFNRTYGSLGGVVGFMTWIWLSVMVALLGAELNATFSGAQRER